MGYSGEKNVVFMHEVVIIIEGKEPEPFDNLFNLSESFRTENVPFWSA